MTISTHQMQGGARLNTIGVDQQSGTATQALLHELDQMIEMIEALGAVAGKKLDVLIPPVPQKDSGAITGEGRFGSHLFVEANSRIRQAKDGLCRLRDLIDRVEL